MSDLLTLTNPVMSSLAFCSCALGLKMLAMSFLTVKNRFAKKAFTNPEDIKGGKVKVDEDVERVRRNHLNDLENIPIFILVGLMYTMTNPAVSTAMWHFRIFTLSRFTHMLAYQIPLPQPSRSLAFIVGVGTIASMAIRTMYSLY